MSVTDPPSAILTDVFGTVVDWRTTVTNHLSQRAHAALNSPSKSIPSQVRTAAAEISWPAFAQLWRESYYRFTRTFDPESMRFKSIDEHHVESLGRLLEEHAVAGLWTDEETVEMALIWHFLDAWPDSAAGLGRLNAKFETATLSNGNLSLLRDLAKHGELPYKHFFSGEDFGAYKPDKRVYLGAAERLGLRPERCALVAAHLGDLKAARGCGYQTVYVERPGEEGWKGEMVEQARWEGWVDMWVKEGDGGFEEVARRFGIGENEGQRL